MDVSSRLTILRESRKITKNHLSKISGVAQSYIGDIESGKKQPTVEVLSRLCTALGVSLSEFFREDKPEGEMSPLIRELVASSERLSDEQLRVLIQLTRSMK